MLQLSHMLSYRCGQYDSFVLLQYDAFAILQRIHQSAFIVYDEVQQRLSRQKRPCVLQDIAIGKRNH